MPLTLELLGGFRLLDAEGKAIRVPDRRARGLLAYLALADRAVPRLALAELLSSEGDEQDQRTALRQAVYVARKATAEPDLFVTADDQIGLNEALLVSDVRSFQAAIARGDSESLRAAVELYRGPLLAGERSPSAAFEDWLAGARGELLEQVMRALLTLAASSEAAGEHDPALALARLALDLDPLREDARRQVMRSLAALGQRAAALREYEAGRQLLADELQVRPDDDTEMLREAISRNGEVATHGVSTPSAPAPAPAQVLHGASAPDRSDNNGPGPVGKRIAGKPIVAPWRPAAAVLAVMLVIATGLAIWWNAGRQQAPSTAGTSPEGPAVADTVPPLPDKPSIAVLPFENLSDDPKQERLAGGITEDVITDLSRFRELFVIARHSTEFYRGKAIDVRQIGGELGVQYVLEGSLQVDEDRARVTAKLIDAASGNHVWSERYDRPLDDVFALQGDVTESIAAQLAGFHGVVIQATRETARRKSPARLEAFDLYALGLEQKHLFTKEGVADAQKLFRQALEIDPNYARAHYGLAQTYGIEADYGWRDWQEAMDDWGSTIKKAIALDPYDSGAHSELAFYNQRLGDTANSLAALDEALSLNPGDADVLATAGLLLPQLGQPKRGLELTQRAVRINPHFPDWYNTARRETYFHNRRFEETIEILDKKQNRSPLRDPLVRAMSYAQLGRAEEARTSVVELFEDQPDWSAERYLSGSGKYGRDVELNLFLDSVEKAQLPLCATQEQLAAYPEIEPLVKCEAERSRQAALREVTGAPDSATEALPLPDKPSIAVLPFENLSGNPKQERLADGITEDVITDLTRFRELFVIAAHSTEFYKGKAVDVRQIGRELGVQYVLEGSLQVDQDRARVTAQLIDAGSGNHVWSERYDRPLDDVFAIQDEVTGQIVATIAGHHGVLARFHRETSRARSAERLRAFHYYSLGMEAKHKFTKQDNLKTQAFFKKALDLDPTYSLAYIGLAWSVENQIFFGWYDSWTEWMERLKSYTDKAIALDSSNGEARVLLAMYHRYENDFPAAMAQLDLAFDLNPNNADGLIIATEIYLRAGHPKKALRSAQKAMRLNPHHPDFYHGIISEAYFYNGRFDECISATSIRSTPSPLLGPLRRAMSHAQLGRTEEAKQEALEVLKESPDFSAEGQLGQTGSFVRDIELNLFLDSVEKAGLPLCATEAQLANYPDMRRLEQCERWRAGG